MGKIYVDGTWALSCRHSSHSNPVNVKDRATGSSTNANDIWSFTAAAKIIGGNTNALMHYNTILTYASWNSLYLFYLRKSKVDNKYFRFNLRYFRLLSFHIQNLLPFVS